MGLTTSSIRTAINSVLAASVLLLPFMASAATLLDTLAFINTVLNALIGLFITLAIVMFFYGLIKYMTKLGDKEGQSSALNTMLYGIIALFVMVSIWGILRLLQSTFKVQGNEPIVPKGIQLNTGSQGYYNL